MAKRLSPHQPGSAGRTAFAQSHSHCGLLFNEFHGAAIDPSPLEHDSFRGRYLRKVPQRPNHRRHSTGEPLFTATFTRRQRPRCTTAGMPSDL